MTVVLVVGAVCASYLSIRLHRASDLLAASPIGPATHAVIFVIDGAGPADLSLAPTPHISDLAHRGVTYTDAWAGQLENVGPASNATIATGLYPRSHGVIGMEWRDPRTGALQRPADLAQVQQGALDQVMEARGSSPLAALLKARYARARILSAGDCADANTAGSWLADYVICPVRRGRLWVPGSVTGHRLPVGALAGRDLRMPAFTGTGLGGYEGWRLGRQDDWLAQYTVLAMRATHPVLTVVNFPEIAAVAPYLTAESRAGTVRALVQGVDRDIGRIVAEVRREGVVNGTVFVVTSSQAVTTFPAALASADVDRAITAAGGQRVYVDLGQDTLAGLADNLQAQPVAQVLQDEHLRGIDALYYKSRTANAWQYQAQYVDPDLPASFARAVAAELDTMTSNLSADLVIVGSPETGTVRVPLTGSGLGSQWNTQHIPLIIAGHGVTAGVVSHYPARLVDIAPSLEAIMGLDRPAEDGVVLGDAMAKPPDGALDAQRTQQARLAPLVKALITRPNDNVG